MKFLSHKNRRSAIDIVLNVQNIRKVTPDKDDVIIVDCSMLKEQFDSEIRPLLDKGYRFIYDQLWESLHHKVKSDWVLPYQENGIAFFGHTNSHAYGWDLKRAHYVPMHFWYHSAIDTFRWGTANRPPDPNREATHDFLMPINTRKIDRDLFLTKLGNRIDKSIYSKGWEKKYLPGDADGFNDRHFNTNWYKDTLYSVVLESWVHGPVFLTEKTFKAIQYGHPFLVFGVQGSLDLLKKYEFETFPGLFDEKYDSEPDTMRRIEMIINQIDAFDQSKLQSVMLSVNRNWNRFHDRIAVNELLKKEVYEPINRKFCS